jgi:Zn-dependent peptidase ImmA (M78 family)
MRHGRGALASVATIRAAQMRAAHGVRLEHPVCPFDIASSIGIEVRFADISSMEGVYRAGKEPLIVISSLRPSGRQVFTCAHELGHDVFCDGDQLDELVETRRESRKFDRKEYQADCFAAALLMPKTAVGYGFATRGWQPSLSTPAQVFTVSAWLGVGYTTLARHIAVLDLANRAHSEWLLRSQPKNIRRQMAGCDCPGLIIVDQHWMGRPVDVTLGDFLICPPETHCCDAPLDVVDRSKSRVIFRAASPGEGVIGNTDFSVIVRVMRNEYVGRAVFRFLAEED